MSQVAWPIYMQNKYASPLLYTISHLPKAGRKKSKDKQERWNSGTLWREGDKGLILTRAWKKDPGPQRIMIWFQIVNTFQERIWLYRFALGLCTTRSLSVGLFMSSKVRRSTNKWQIAWLYGPLLMKVNREWVWKPSLRPVHIPIAGVIDLCKPNLCLFSHWEHMFMNFY